jgi:hypothetical protein
VNRRIVFFPAYDRTDPDPKKDYGVGCLDLRFLVEGKSGTVEFELLTQWFQEHIMKRRLDSLKHDVWIVKQDFLLRHFLDPFPADVCYFSPKRISEDDSYWEKGVYYTLEGKPCYYGYKYKDEKEDRPAREIACRKLVEEGDESLWKYLEDYYEEVFGKDSV